MNVMTPDGRTVQIRDTDLADLSRHVARLSLSTLDLAEVVFDACCDAIARLSGNLSPEEVGSDLEFDVDWDGDGIDDPYRVWLFEHVLGTGAIANARGAEAQLGFVLSRYEDVGVVVDELERIAAIKKAWNDAHPGGPAYPPGPPIVTSTSVETGRSRTYGFSAADAV
ncbi:hypothetical protein GON03_05545 [Nocardioides sp. MAH-18]|uniref:Uncharacterized protein n=1 Tax=Nocardioides agri TaxID=2682843 RepID=A0A6L6XPI9_9ACTN|nr:MULTISPECIES: hypothetical protein [unclassified Nocardioides]MBA2953772.1 hypothetical protein [Nocardioides sp. CGMCC 1.13656]MVQ48637.1 hypothetical protein [Nocardioides sp. MAH-18]